MIQAPQMPTSQAAYAPQMPTFQPAYAAPMDPPDSQPVVKDQKQSEEAALKSLLTLVGACMLILVILTPVWDMLRLLNSSTYVYFMGRTMPAWIIVFCVVSVLAFIVTMLVVERNSKRNRRAEYTFLFLFVSMITAVGLGLVFLSFPLQMEAAALHRNLIEDCTAGAKVEPLFAYYSVLLNLRRQPGCINKASVEQCKGYEERPPYTGFLKHMENTYGCSGFCYSKVPLEDQPPIEKRFETAVLMQEEEEAAHKHSSRASTDHDTQGVFLLASGQALSKAIPDLPGKGIPGASPLPTWEQTPKGYGHTVNNMMSTGWMDAYPPTLFSSADFVTTCEGGASRELAYTAVEMGNMMYMQGMLLLIIAVLVSMLNAMTMCRKRKFLNASPDGEGQYRAYPKEVVL